MKSSGPSVFGVRLRHLRMAAGLTQEMLAERSGMSVDAISTLESGRRRRPHPQTVSLLAHGLGLTDDERERLAAMASELRRRQAGRDCASSPPFPSTSSRAAGPAPHRSAAALLCLLVAAAVLIPGDHSAHCTEACMQGMMAGDRGVAASLAGLQSASYVLTAEPERYSLGRLLDGGPGTHAAQRIDADIPYRLVIRVHDWRASGTSMFVESIRLLLREVRPAPTPLRVWTVGRPVDHTGNPYLARYSGQPAGTSLVAQYAGPMPLAHVQFPAGESDELGVAVTSDVTVQLRFQVVLDYRIASELQVRSLPLPDQFTVTFSDALNWQPYQFREGRLVPA